MSFSRPIQWYHSHEDPIWPDGTFNLFLNTAWINNHEVTLKVAIKTLTGVATGGGEGGGEVGGLYELDAFRSNQNRFFFSLFRPFRRLNKAYNDISARRVLKTKQLLDNRLGLHIC